jgi:hypothetical protein
MYGELDTRSQKQGDRRSRHKGLGTNEHVFVNEVDVAMGMLNREILN